MLEIDDKIISFEVLEKKFSCNLSICKGECCVSGDYGAPVEPEEVAELEKYFPIYSKYLSKKSKKVIKKQGFAVKEFEDELTTPLVNDNECAYVYFDNGMALCAIEKAFLNNEIPFQKPISCHLYPIRTKRYADFEAVNYHEWNICSSALVEGSTKNIPVISCVKSALIRKYGTEWFEALEYASTNLNTDI